MSIQSRIYRNRIRLSEAPAPVITPTAPSDAPVVQDGEVVDKRCAMFQIRANSALQRFQAAQAAYNAKLAERDARRAVCYDPEQLQEFMDRANCGDDEDCTRQRRNQWWRHCSADLAKLDAALTALGSRLQYARNHLQWFMDSELWDLCGNDATWDDIATSSDSGHETEPSILPKPVPKPTTGGFGIGLP